MLIGIVIVAIGAYIYLQAKFPPSPIDNLMIAMQQRFGISLRMSKTIGEISALVIAYLLGGPIGL